VITVEPSPATFLDPSAIDAVVFDIGGVFTIRHRDFVRPALMSGGFDAPRDPQAYHRAHHAAVRAMSDLLADNDAVHEYQQDMWAHWEQGYMRGLGIAEDQVAAAAEAVMAVVSTTEVKDMWCQLLDENVEGFRRIVASGIPVAIVSNNDGTAEAQLLHFGICQVGDGPLPSVSIVVDSGIVGAAKPDPAIFQPALAVLGTEPSRTLYIGDTVHADVRGAEAAGMRAVQLDPYDLHADFDHARVATVSALADALGV
jgi:putative hydrolase of the HAD superfamily